MEELDFSKRAELSEYMDGPCSYEELRGCLRDLAVINRITRAHRPTMLWLEEIFAAGSQDGALGRPMKLVDVGCGYGDMLRKIERWAAKRGVAMELVGVDVNAHAIRAAGEMTREKSRVRYVVSDVESCAEAQDADLITASGMTHHLREAEIVGLLRWMEQSARVGWIVTDLHRMQVPYRVFSALSRGPWWHRFIRPDGMASIRRAFVEEDWVRMCAAAEIEAGTMKIQTHRPARLAVSRRK